LCSKGHGGSSPPFGTLPKIHIFTQQFDYLQYLSDSPGGLSFLPSNTELVVLTV